MTEQVDTSIDLLTPGEVSTLIRVPVSTLARWRCEGTGIAYVSLGRRVLYRRQDVAEFIADNIHSIN